MESLQPILIAKHEKACSRENIKERAGQSLDKEMMAVRPRSNQPWQQRPGKGTKWRKAIELLLQKGPQSLTLNMPYCSRKRRNDPEGDSEVNGVATGPPVSARLPRASGRGGGSCSLERGGWGCHPSGREVSVSKEKMFFFFVFFFSFYGRTRSI